MLIPSIDLLGGRIVQLVQGERLALASDDLDGWIAKFADFPIVQLIDLDAAMGQGDNAALVAPICAAPALPGRRRDPDDRHGRRRVLDAGAQPSSSGSALFRDGGVDHGSPATSPTAIGARPPDRRRGQPRRHVVIHGWRTLCDHAGGRRPALEPFGGEFLYTHVDTKG